MAVADDATGADAAPEPAAPAPRDRDNLSVKDLARAILAREFRPRVSELRRLAEAVLDKPKKKSKAKKKSNKRASKADGKERKLSRIPQGPLGA